MLRCYLQTRCGRAGGCLPLSSGGRSQAQPVCGKIALPLKVEGAGLGTGRLPRAFSSAPQVMTNSQDLPARPSLERLVQRDRIWSTQPRCFQVQGGC